jgi:tetratricopeptide (TPR) repeat protein
MKKLTYILIALGLTATSCKKFVTIDNAPNSLSPADAFATDGTATSAVLGLYNNYTTTPILQYLTWAGGMLGHELQNQYAGSTPDIAQFQNGDVANTNMTILNYFWLYPYQEISYANQAIDGLTKSTTLTTSVKNQLLGESYFMRACNFFYMANYFGGVPLSTDPAMLENAYLPRSSKEEIYAQVISDLKAADELLPGTYTGTLRTRINKYAVEALLARVYLYQKDYTNAVAYSSKVIDASDVKYSLAKLDSTFKNVSPEIILQFATRYGYASFNFRPTAQGIPPSYYLQPALRDAFETGDNRKTKWTDSLIYSGSTYYMVNKYKLQTATAGDEYNVLLRLGEVYLIRAEASAQLSDLTTAENDLNAIRNRAGLGNTAATTKDDLLTAIAHERQVELFGEFGHRWFDLVRTGKADEVLSKVKTAWAARDTLMPIPYSQILLNTKLTPNPGY